MKLGLVAIALVLAVSLALFGCTQQALQPAATPTPTPPTLSSQSAAEAGIDELGPEFDEIDSLVGSLDNAEINDSDVNLT